MRSILPLLLLSTSSLVLFSNALPLTPNQPAIRPRAKYSVVAVDGGSGNDPAPTDTGDNDSSSPTITQTQDHTTTVTTSATQAPPTTPTITATKVVTEEGPEKTVQVVKTQEVHETAEPPKPKIQIVNVAADTPSSKQTATATEVVTTSTIICPSSTSRPPYTSVSSSSTPVYTSSYITSPTSTLSSISRSSTTPRPATSSPTSSVISWNKNSYTNSSAILPITQIPASPQSYDDGKWHTTYRAWNASSTSSSTYSSTSTTSLSW